MSLLTRWLLYFLARNLLSLMARDLLSLLARDLLSLLARNLFSVLASAVSGEVPLLLNQPPLPLEFDDWSDNQNPESEPSFHQSSSSPATLVEVVDSVSNAPGSYIDF